jgi:transmembrane sensor
LRPFPSSLKKIFHKYPVKKREWPHYLIRTHVMGPNTISMNKAGKSPADYQIEDFITDGSFVNYCFRSNADDIAFWENWLLNNPSYQQPVLAARELLKTLTLTLDEEEIAAEMTRIKAAIDDHSISGIKRRPSIARLFTRRNTLHPEGRKAKSYIRYLLPLLFVVLAGTYLLRKQLFIRPDHQIERVNNSNDPIVFSLSDGTVITLASQGILRYPSSFGIGDRTVFLDGEAQFQVTGQTDHPFRVQEGDIMATVLGTVFNVKKRSGDSVMLVELIRGKLKVENINKDGGPLQSILLNPDERVVYNHYDHMLYKERWQSQPEFPLEVNLIVFSRNNFKEIADKIKIAFGVTVINQSAKRVWSFSGKFENATAKEIVENICLVEGLKSQISGDTILIK